MKIILDQRTKSQARKRGLERSEAMLRLVDQEEDERKRGLLRSLIGPLLAADSRFARLSTKNSFALACAVLELMDRREENIAFARWTPEGEMLHLLLINLPDFPIATDSLRLLACAREGLLEFISCISLAAVRDGAGRLAALGASHQDGRREALIFLQVEKSIEAESVVSEALDAAAQLSRDENTLKMRLVDLHAPEPYGDFLDWLRTGAFIPYSYRRWVKSAQGPWEERSEERLGIARLEKTLLTSFFGKGQTGGLRDREPRVAVYLTCLDNPFCRFERLTCICVRELSADGWSIDHEFLGLLSRRAMEDSAFAVPALRRKLEQALSSFPVEANTHEIQRARDLFDAFPKVELFFMEENQLWMIVRSLLEFLARNGRFKLLLLASPNPATFVLLGLQPADLFQDKNLAAFEKWLANQIGASLECTRILRGRSNYVGICWTLSTQAEEIHLDMEHLENGWVRISRFWEQRFKKLMQRVTRLPADAFSSEYLSAAPDSYRDLTPPGLAVRDALHGRRVMESGGEEFELWRKIPDDEAGYHYLRLYSRRERLLDELLPLLENIGLRVADQVQFPINLRGKKFFIKSFSVRPASASASPLMGSRRILLGLLADLLAEKVESDGLNKLSLLTGLASREIDVFRGYRNYYLQLGTRSTHERFEQALANNPGIARLLFEYFKSRFDAEELAAVTENQTEDILAAARTDIASALDRVFDFSEDRVLRDLFNLIDATVRTNYFLRCGRDDYFLAFKIESLGVLNMPAPAPLFEVYVHSARMEGIHLRGARVARGGIRWSDRHDDFRAEILGLMQTQMIKNALIVPHGAKGGFVVKSPPGGRKEMAKRVEQAYSTLIRGLLDLTDNVADSGTVRSPAVVSHDNDGPYLVVAADKGTAHLSDTANAISKEYRFWLGDAFASGGSQGYDHKKLGITARGAFECVRRHFLELGRDIDTQPFTVVGIGGMNGDVFGNGMLLSKSIRLLGAFGPRHIFLDPDPDCDAAYRERKRLFGLADCAWTDYDPALISPGGGVYERGAKDIPLSPSVRLWLGVNYPSVDGETLIRLLLTAPVDLLWLGGIGTFVKASGEVNEKVGDRANDPLRVDACALRAKVVGEGANLGFTQKGRIEFALAGGMINMDAVDNSGGVDLSDHEVNLKILMGAMNRKGMIAGEPERNRLLQEMTEEICDKVLANNRHQSLCISLDRERCLRDPESFLEVADYLENSGLLDRNAESFPTRREVIARQGEGLTRPELAVLMLCCKLHLKQALLEISEFRWPVFRPWLESYFPRPLRERFSAQLHEHPLGKEITATILVNTVINQAGCGFPALAGDVRSESLANAVGAYLSFDEIVGGRSLRQRLLSLGPSTSSKWQYQYLLRLENLLLDYCRWAMESSGLPEPDPRNLAIWRSLFNDYVDFIIQSATEAERGELADETLRLERAGFAVNEALLLSWVDRLGDFPTLADLALKSSVGVPKAASVYRAVSKYLGFDQIDPRLSRLTSSDSWERRVRLMLTGRIRLNLARLAQALIDAAHSDPIRFFESHGDQRRLERISRLRRELHQTPTASTLPYAALSDELQKLADCCAAKACEGVLR